MIGRIRFTVENIFRQHNLPYVIVEDKQMLPSQQPLCCHKQGTNGSVSHTSNDGRFRHHLSRNTTEQAWEKCIKWNLQIYWLKCAGHLAISKFPTLFPHSARRPYRKIRMLHGKMPCSKLGLLAALSDVIVTV